MFTADEKSISAIIPLNDPSFLENIKSLQNFKLIREVIVLNNSGEGISKYIRSKKFLVEDVQKFDHGGTRNLGASISKGDILLFMTQDARPCGDDFDINIIRSFSGKVKLVYGKHIPLEENPFEAFERRFLYGERVVVKPAKFKPDGRIDFPDFFASDVCLAVDRNTFWEVGGYPENVISSEELILSYKIVRAGYKIMYNPSVKVFHSHHNEKILESFRRWFDVGVFFSYYPFVKRGFYKFAIHLFISEFIFLLFKHPNLIGNLIARGGIRFIAIQIGLRYKYIPSNFKKCFSMNKSFWI